MSGLISYLSAVNLSQPFLELNMIDLLTISPQYYERDYTPCIKGYSVAADRITIKIPKLATNIGSMILPIAEQEILLSTAANWDSVATDYTVAANRSGKDFYVYALSAGQVILSANSTAPTGYTADNSRLIGGFHCLCLAVGTISGHTLTGFLAGDIIPASVWDINHRPVCSPAGMVYARAIDIWVDIYLQSGTGAATRSANGATITDTRDWMDFTDDLGAVGKRMLSDSEFQVAAAGSNEKTNILGSADPVVTGSHVDTASRRMISNIGCEDMCGALWQWLLDQSYRNDDAGYSGAWAYYALPGNKGSLYRQSGSGDVKLLAGGFWYSGASCGSRSRYANYSRWTSSSAFGSRGCARRQG
jgi:hypothetical protein